MIHLIRSYITLNWSLDSALFFSILSINLDLLRIRNYYPLSSSWFVAWSLCRILCTFTVKCQPKLRARLSSDSAVAAVAFWPCYVWKRNVTFFSLVDSREEDEKGVKGWSGCWQAGVCEVIDDWKKRCEHNQRTHFCLSLKARVAVEETERLRRKTMC